MTGNIAVGGLALAMGDDRADSGLAAPDFAAGGAGGSSLAFLAGGGTLGAMMRAKDWSDSPLGGPEAWPDSLRISVSTCLNCSFPILIWWGPDLVKLYNDAYAAIIAEKHPRALGMPGRLVWPEIWDTIGPMLAGVMERGEAVPADDLLLMLERHGYPEECYFSFSYSPIRDQAGRVVGVFCPVVETTKRVFAERRARFLLKLDGALRALSDPAAIKRAASRMVGEQLGADRVGYSDISADGSYAVVEGEWNGGGMPSVAGVHRLIDYGETFSAALRRGEIVRVNDVRDESTLSGAAAAFERLSLRALFNVPLVKDGRLVAVFFVHHAVSRVWSEQEVGYVRDVADRTWNAVERARAEAALRRSEEDLRVLNGSLAQTLSSRTAERDRMWRLSTDVMLVARLDSGIVAVNPAWQTQLGWREDELLGRHFMDFVHPDDVADTTAEMGRLAQGLSTLRFENRYRCCDGSYRWLSWAAVPDGDLVHAVGRDVTVEKEAAAALEVTQDRLRQAQRMEALGQLAGGIAHDFNNVLQAVSGGLALIERRAGDAQAVQRLAVMAAEAAARGAAITGRLLAFARKDALKTVAVGVATLLEGVREMLAHTISAEIAVGTRIAPGAMALLADAAQLETVLVNLAVNARDAMPQGGTLTLAAEPETVIDAALHPARLKAGHYVRLSVSDTGEGMDRATLARAGDPFFTTKPRGKGTGLGLAMARGFAEQSGGGFALESAPDQGTVVTLWFPVGTAIEPAAGAVVAAGPPVRQRVRVLMVDDDPAVRHFLGAHLADHGYVVTEAADGLDALARLDAGESVDLLVSDLSMPGMNGLTLIQEARKRDPRLPALLMTGYADAAILGDPADAPLAPCDILRKPVAIAELLGRAAALTEAADKVGESVVS